jgi:dTDP-4-amino-4,6-dideoxygalactose transaminase
MNRSLPLTTSKGPIGSAGRAPSGSTVILEPAITNMTSALLVVHQVGLRGDLQPIVPIGQAPQSSLIEDAACSSGSEMLWNGEWQKIGKPHGDVSCFSFHPLKLVSTGDGGMLTTQNPEWDAQFRLLRQHAMSVPTTVRYGSTQVIFESYPTVGFNYRMTDIQAAVGREQLKRLPAILQQRRRLASRYADLAADIPGLAFPAEPSWARSNWQSYCVRLPKGLDQRSVMQALLDKGISTRRGIMCSHREPAYAELALRQELPWSEQAQDECILLPLYAQMSDREQLEVVDALREAVLRR